MLPFTDDREEFAWAVGIIEGEGWIGSQTKTLIPAIQVEMTDLDVIKRLQDFLGGRVRSCAPRMPEYKPSWKWALSKKHLTIPLLEQMKMYMSERRSERIQLVLNKFYERGF